MRVFVTGGTGLIGSAVVAELLQHDPHRGRARPLRRICAGPSRRPAARRFVAGSPTLGAIRAGAEKSDGVIHLAFGNDFSSAEAVRAVGRRRDGRPDRHGRGLDRQRPAARPRCRGHPGCPGRVSTEDDPLADRRPGRWDAGGPSNAILGLASQGVRAGVGPTAAHRPTTTAPAVSPVLLTNIARQSGVSGYPGDGDPALAGRARARRGRALPAGTRARAGRHGLACRGRRGRCGARHRRGHRPATRPAGRAGAAGGRFGPLGPIFATDQPSSSTDTRRTLGWEPTHPSLLADLENLEP